MGFPYSLCDNCSFMYVSLLMKLKLYTNRTFHGIFMVRQWFPNQKKKFHGNFMKYKQSMKTP